MNERLADGSGQQILLDDDDDPLVREVGRALIDHGFGSGVSLFDPVRVAWSAETVDELHRCYNEQLDTGADAFLVKLKRQVGDTSDDVILLTAELLTLQALPLANFTQPKKRARIAEVLSWMREPVTIPPEVDAAFAQRSWNGGTGAHTMLWKWLSDAVGFLRAWWAVSDDERARALTDPWAWEEVVHRIPGMNSLREALLYLAFPGYFLPIINVTHKAAIRAAFGYRLESVTADLDRDLYRITISLQQEAGVPIDYYQPPYAQEWSRRREAPAERRAWLVRPGTGGHALVERWQQEGFVSLAGTHLADVSPGATLPQVRAAVEQGYQHLDYAQRVALATEYFAFLTRMADGDLVTTVDRDRLSVGVVAGEPDYDPAAEGTRLRRAVDWQDAEPPLVDSLPAPLPAEVDQQGTVVDLTAALDVLSRMLEAPSPSAETAQPVPEPADTGVSTLASATEDLAVRLHMDRGWLQELIDLLRARQQVVFYGPPGTGKTYLAQEIARHVAGRGAVQLVQFHPSYAYEDFFEGFRPSDRDGAVGFALTPGPLRRIAADAKANPGEPYVLIVDEINRANLPKVFGELYFLLEYRNRSIPLQYSPAESFALPANLLLIGTMNTADRSIALVDAAIRRRFAFVELHPDEEPVRDLLANWLTASHKDSGRAELLRALNDAIGEEDRDFKIGPSYLMRSEADTTDGLQRIWRYDLLPLLEEHYYGRYGRRQVHDLFGLAANQRRARSSGPGGPTTAESGVRAPPGEPATADTDVPAASGPQTDGAGSAPPSVDGTTGGVVEADSSMETPQL